MCCNVLLDIDSLRSSVYHAVLLVHIGKSYLNYQQFDFIANIM